ncbi:alpha/beta hydrolase [Glutamicibacter sp. BSL13]
MNTAQDFQLRDGRRTKIHFSGSRESEARTLVMHYGTPHSGQHPSPLVGCATDLQLRLISVTRPGFPGAERRPGRTVADSAKDVIEVVDELGIEHFATAGYSGGGPHALALAALLGERVTATAAFASPAPFEPAPSSFKGMAGGGAGLRAAAQGVEARTAYQSTAEFPADSFTAADWQALSGRWASIGQQAQAAADESDDGEIDDDLAFVSPWGVDLAGVCGAVDLYQAVDDHIIPLHHVDLLASMIQQARIHKMHSSGHVAVLDELLPWMRSLVAD